ncbi:MAG: divergent polysaccharide deacetylase family protein [Bacillota bacterium]|nr:divergent polysaccharide deacetylase family protein [Bacillota bacterium]
MKIVIYFSSAVKKLIYFAVAVIISSLILFINMDYFHENNTIPGNSSVNSVPGDAKPSVAGTTRAKLAIIIDDFGQNRNGVAEMLSIKRNLTMAVMPFLTYTRTDAQTAHKNKHEVIVHLPMESYKGEPAWVGPRPIITTMKDFEIKKLVTDAFNDVPFAAGANIHMGTKAGGDQRVISDVLDVIKGRNLYFVDSRTGNTPVARNIAKKKKIICYENDVFIDGKDQSLDYMKNQLKAACEIAQKTGKAVAIGHVGAEGGKITAQAINEMLSYFDSKNIQLVFVSELGK